MSESVEQTNLREAMDQMAALASDAHHEWKEHKPFTPIAEYERGYMNAMHQAIALIESSRRSS